MDVWVGRGNISLFWFIRLFTQSCLLYAKHSDGCGGQKGETPRELFKLVRHSQRTSPFPGTLPPSSLPPLFPSVCKDVLS